MVAPPELESVWNEHAAEDSAEACEDYAWSAAHRLGCFYCLLEPRGENCNCGESIVYVPLGNYAWLCMKRKKIV